MSCKTYHIKLNGKVYEVEIEEVKAGESIAPTAETIEKPKAEVKCVTLEQVRAVLAEKSRAGKTADVKDLLTRFGVNKLSELDASRYGELLKEAEGI